MNKLHITFAKSSKPTEEELLAKKLLPEETETLYTEFTNKLLEYERICELEDENKHLLNNNALLYLHLSEELKKASTKKDYEEIRERSVQLRIKRILLNKNAAEYKKQREELLSKMKELLLEINRGHSIYDLYSYEDESYVSAYINLRKNCFKIVEFIGTFILKKEKLDPKDRIAFDIAIMSLKTFTLEDNKKEIRDLMNLISDYLINRKVNYQKLSSLNQELESTKYSKILEKLNSTYKKEISPLSLN